MDSAYMQSERVRGMGSKPDGGIPSPRPLESSATEDDAGYTGSEERCATCAHFDGQSQCAAGVNGGTCEPMGHCSKHEAGESADDERTVEDGG